MKSIDARGLACPQPVILTKKALDVNENVTTIVDNETAKLNLMKLAKSLGCEVAIKEGSDQIEISFFKKADEKIKSVEERQNTSQLVYVIGSNLLGRGSEELGKILMKGFIYTLTQMEYPPSKIVFLNAGIYLTCIESESLDDLKQLMAKGTGIVSCGTCLNFFNLADKLAVGEVSNMYEIVEIITSGQNTVII
ncbi:MAG: sulfurtransferase-like selenium metabolism protein YedF [Eubacteriales bacterium]|nr:sulfurtransferase-like selenium metabolism protein YedF [Eubacteriales bacterium]